jgi:hypothetical protein
MAEVVSEHEEAAPDEATLLARRRAEQKVPRHRFGLAYLALAALLGAAVGLFVVLVGNGGKDSGPSWSAWKPTERGVQGLDQIAKYVGHQYALPSGRQLVGILSTPPVVQSQGQAVPVRAIGVTTGLPGETLNDAQFFGAEDAWAYVLCGFGERCAISEGKASTARYDLLRREALELALYTFKYDSGVKSVVTFMPPPRGKQANTVLFFRRDDTKTALDVPLARTLRPPKSRLLPGRMSAADIGAVRRYTRSRVYGFQFQQIPDGTAILVLQPVA